MVRLHDELAVQVVTARPWGIEVVTEHGERGLVDNVKIPSWRASGIPPAVGERVQVVVLDELREPFRASALGEDFEVARRLRVREGGE